MKQQQHQQQKPLNWSAPTAAAASSFVYNGKSTIHTHTRESLVLLLLAAKWIENKGIRRELGGKRNG